MVSFFGSFTYVGMYLKIVVATLQRRACTCQPRSSRIPDDEKINSYGTINKQPQTFNLLFFFFFFRVISFNALGEIFKARIFGTGTVLIF